MFMDLGGGIISPLETSPGEGAGAVHKNSALCGVSTWPPTLIFVLNTFMQIYKVHVSIQKPKLDEVALTQV